MTTDIDKAVERDLYPALLEQAGTYIETLYRRYKVPTQEMALSPDKYRAFAVELRDAISSANARAKAAEEVLRDICENRTLVVTVKDARALARTALATMEKAHD